jgi:tRNA (guanine-N7-)-methyltransferase
LRLRHIPEADSAILAHPLSINEPDQHKGKWNLLFGNNNPIHLEIGMGKGKFLTDMAFKYPNYNFIGIELYSSVLYRALQRIDSIDNKPENILFICVDARNIADIFEFDEIKQIYLNFSDPWPKDRHAKRRLTSPEFQSLYSKILSPGHTIEFKTDNKDLFDYSVSSFNEYGVFKLTAITYDLHNDPELSRNNILTEYEAKFSEAGNPICKLIAEKI